MGDQDGVSKEEDARRIGEAARKAQDLLRTVEATPQGEIDAFHYVHAASVLGVALHELLDAISAVTATRRSGGTSSLSDEEESFARSAGVRAEALTDERRPRSEDWLVWSAVRDARERAEWEKLAALTAFDVVPGLREVVRAFPDDFTELDMARVMTAPMEELGGASPVRWLLCGGDPGTLVSLIEEFGCAP